MKLKRLKAIGECFQLQPTTEKETYLLEFKKQKSLKLQGLLFTRQQENG